jgi:peptide/nickel transport system permease protein
MGSLEKPKAHHRFFSLHHVSDLLARLFRGLQEIGWPLWFLLGFLILGAISPYIAPYDPYMFDVPNSFEAPSLLHQFGRDLLSRVMIGSRTLVTISGLATLIAIVVGVAWGMLAAYSGGIRDELLMRAVDITISIPAMLVAVMILTVLGSSNRNLILAAGLIYSPFTARVVRSASLVIIGQEYIDAARIAGESTTYILFREVLPNLIPVLGVETAMRFGFVVLLVASLGFLGLGVQPPTPDWGLIVSESRNYMRLAPWLIVVPASGIGALVIACHALADKIGVSKKPTIDN